MTSLAGSAGDVLIQYEKQLSSGTIGSLWLGRLASGAESGRLVTVRRIPSHLFDVGELDRVTHIAGVIARLKSPSIVKLLGVIREESELLCVSEYLAGVRMVDLQRFAIETDNSIPASVAVRLILEVARASVVSHRLMNGLGIQSTQRVIFGDGVLVALFGEVLLTDVGILADMLRCSRVAAIPALNAELAPEEIQHAPSNCGSPEVFTLAVWLWELLACHWLFPRQLDTESCRRAVTSKPILRIDSIERMGMPLPEPLVRLLDQALERDPRKRINSLEGLIEVIEQLPSQCVASSEQLGNWIRNVAPQILPGSENSAVWPLELEQTRRFSASESPVMLGPADSHDWDPPTFAERQLVAPSFKIAKVEKTTLEPTMAAAYALSIPVSNRSRRRRRAPFGFLIGGIALLIAVGTSLLLFTKRPNSERAHATPEPQRASAQPLPTKPEVEAPPSRVASDDAPAEDAQEVGTVATQAKDINKTQGQASIKVGAKREKSEPQTNSTESGTYRPHKIAPFRPKGI